MAKKKQIFDINKAKEIGKMVTQPILPKTSTPPPPKKTEVVKEKAAPIEAAIKKTPKPTKKAKKSTSEELAYKRHVKYRNENVRIYCNRDLFEKLKQYAKKQRKSPKIIVEEYIESLNI